MKKTLTLQDYLDGFKNQDRTILGRAITLVESTHPDHQKLSQELLTSLLPQTGKAKRLGISGTPGVGKSTFIEAFGKHLTSLGKKVAVLAVDPTSQVSGGSILGDKTRMNELAVDPMAFIRPSPSGETLGGVARRTRESLLLCEAFGFDYVLVETVGVGQSETTVAEMVDIFIMLLQPGAGDDLQGIKRGILEIVDMVVVTKDDGENQKIIQKAKHDYGKALEILRHDSGYIPSVLSCSSLTKSGLSEVSAAIEKFLTTRKDDILSKRKQQSIEWMWSLVHEGLDRAFHDKVSPQEIEKVKAEILKQSLTAPLAAEKLLKLFNK
ncbi:MAG: methylmalonyl Co-A mutase-associated GTPase MeaB [Bacteriovoracaceae bacterium]